MELLWVFLFPPVASICFEDLDDAWGPNQEEDELVDNSEDCSVFSIHLNNKPVYKVSSWQVLHQEEAVWSFIQVSFSTDYYNKKWKSCYDFYEEFEACQILLQLFLLKQSQTQVHQKVDMHT